MGGKAFGWLTPERIPGFAAGFYDRLQEKKSRMYEELADDIIREIKYGNVLDVGTGPGHLPVEIAKREPEVEITGIDLTEKMIERAKRKAESAGVEGQVDFEVGDASELRFEDETYDLVVSNITLHHWNDPVRVLDECYRVLKPEREAWIYDHDGNASDERIRLWQEEVLQEEPMNLNWLEKIFAKFVTRLEIEVDAYSRSEISEIADETEFEEYEIGEKRISEKPYCPKLIKAIFRKRPR